MFSSTSAAAYRWPNVVLTTYVDEKIRRALKQHASKQKMPMYELMPAVIQAGMAALGIAVDVEPRPGLPRKTRYTPEQLAAIEARNAAREQMHAIRAQQKAEADARREARLARKAEREAAAAARAQTPAGQVRAKALVKARAALAAKRAAAILAKEAGNAVDAD